MCIKYHQELKFYPNTLLWVTLAAVTLQHMCGAYVRHDKNKMSASTMLWLIAVFRITERSSRLHWCTDTVCDVMNTHSELGLLFFLSNLCIKIKKKKTKLCLQELCPWIIPQKSLYAVFILPLPPPSPPPPSISRHFSLCFSWHTAVWMCHKSYVFLFFLSLSAVFVTHKQWSFCSSWVSKASLFQKHAGGAGGKRHPGAADFSPRWRLSLVRAPVIKMFSLRRP